LKTQRLYYDEPYLLEFDAHVLHTIDVGGRVGLILDRTAFYPTSGGQPYDTGTLNGVRVVDVFEDEDRVVHVVSEGVDAKAVHGSIDGHRRRDHIQQHSGQHVLSRAFVDLFKMETVSFHMGESTSTIDLAAETISTDQLIAAEEAANRAVIENRPVHVRYVAPQSAAEAGLRKPTERTGEIRVIDMAGFDRSACGGTHVQMTGEIGPILLVGTERVRKQVRVHFVCGFRAIGHARRTHRELDAIGQMLSVSSTDAAASVRALSEELQRLRKHIDELEAKLLDYEAAELQPLNGIVAQTFKGRGIETLKMLAAKVCSREGIVALLADESDQLRVVFARSADRTEDMAALVKKVIERFGGRGGGRPNVAQAGGLQGSATEVLDFAKPI